MLTILGLTIICLAWAYQAYLVIIKKDTIISIAFVGLYILGVLFLVVDGFMSGVSSITWLNLISGFVALVAFVAMMMKK
jgi:hypothetical protein